MILNVAFLNAKQRY